MHYLFFAVLLITSIVAALLLFKDKGGLFFIRVICFVLTLNILLMFNVNWLFKISFNPWMLPAAFLVLGIGWFFICRIYFKKNVLLQLSDSFRKTITFRRVASTAFLLLVGLTFAWLYFEKDWAVPRYRTPDSGIHFLYGNRSSQSGILPLFDRTYLYEASGNLPEFKSHQQSYLPGTAAVFALVHQIIKPQMASVTFQFTNALGFALLATYLIKLAWDREIFRRNKIIYIFFAVLAFLGTNFGFLVASYSGQLWGLIFLLFFLDTFDAYFNGRERMFLPIVALAGMFLTYFYWLPVAAIFVLFNLLRKKKEWIKIIPVPFFSFILGVGYIITILKLKLVGFAAADGGFPSQLEILSDTIFVLPFAMWQIARLFRRQNKKINEIFALQFFCAILVYSIILALLYFFSPFVSHYTAVKSSFAVVPVIWIAALMFIAENFGKLLHYISSFGKSILARRFELINWKPLLVLVFLYAATFALSKIGDNEWSVFVLEKKNADYIFDDKLPVIISRNQLNLLDEVKNEHGELIADGRMFIVAPEDTALWAYAYSGIWPRTLSLVPQGGPREGVYTEMSFYSAWIGDYLTWLKQDTNHALIIFNNDDTDRWISRNGFDSDDYFKVAGKGDDALLVLKKNVMTPFIIRKEDDEENEEKKGNNVSQGKFLAKSEHVLGIMVPIEFEKIQKKGFVANVTMFENYCGNKAKAYKSSVTIKETKNQRKNAKARFIFDEVLENVKGKEYCFEVQLDEEVNDGAVVDYDGSDALYGFVKE